jgi:hypothetical protein
MIVSRSEIDDRDDLVEWLEPLLARLGAQATKKAKHSFDLFLSELSMCEHTPPQWFLDHPFLVKHLGRRLLPKEIMFKLISDPNAARRLLILFYQDVYGQDLDWYEGILAHIAPDVRRAFEQKVVDMEGHRPWPR